jgi:hypothetical protein
MGLHRGAGGFFDGLRIAFLLLAPFGDGPALRQVAMQRVMGGGLVGDDVGARAARFHPRGKLDEDIGRVAQQAHGFGLARLGPASIIASASSSVGLSST